MRAVHVLFYQPQSDDHWINHLVTTFSPPYSHCDIQFDDGVASSIYQNETVYMQAKSFSRNNYKRISLTFTDDECSRIRKFCSNAHASLIGFDLTGMILSYMPFSLRNPSDKTFCSRYIAEALRHSGRPEFSTLHPSCTTPSSLHAILSCNNKSFIDVSEARMRRLT
jgi:hypothetical protein